MLRPLSWALFAWSLASVPVAAQDTTALLRKLRMHPARDTARVDVLVSLAAAFRHDGIRFDHYATEALQLSDSLDYPRGIARIGTYIGDHQEAQLNDIYGALEMFLTAVRAAERAGDERDLLRLYGQLGRVYGRLSRDSLAEAYIGRSIALSRARNDTVHWTWGLTVLGDLRIRQGRFGDAVVVDRQVLRMATALRDTAQAAAGHMALGESYRRLGRPDSANAYLEMAVALYERIGDRPYLAYALAELGGIRSTMGDTLAARTFAEKALQIALEQDFRTEIMVSYQVLAEVAAQRKDYAQAYAFRVLYDTYRDSAFDLRTAERAGHKQAEFEAYRREEHLKQDHERQQALAEAMRARQGMYLLIAVVVALVFGILCYAILRSLRSTRRQHHATQLQKQAVDERQREVIGSITYARDLQQAILPSGELLERHFADSFVLYLPKDIVSGDFYWMEVVGDMVYIAVADATGHGVPGAMVSVVCGHALKHAVKEPSARDTGAILDRTTELMLEVFDRHSNGEDVKDGMDISLLAWHKPTGRMQWSGANLPLWMVPPRGEGGVQKLRPDRQPVAKHPGRRPFNSITFTPAAGTTFYLFSDGFADQFGGPKDRKFMLPRLDELLGRTYGTDLHRQRGAVEQAFLEWKGKGDQTDDVTVLGFRI